MKHLKRISSFLLSLILCLSFFNSMLFTVSAAEAVTLQVLPFLEKFDTDGYVPAGAEGYTFEKAGTEEVVQVVDGALALTTSTASATNRYNKNFLTLNFNKVTTGKLVVEFKLWNDNKLLGYENSKGFVILQSEEGTNAVFTNSQNQSALKTFYRGNGSDTNIILNNSAWDASKWHTVKLVADMDTKTFEMYKDGTKLAESATSETSLDFYDASVNNISKVKIHFGYRGTKIDDLKVYKDLTAEQKTSGYSLLLGETQQAEIIYSPSTESISNLQWQSSDSSVADVSNTGVITAKAKGQTTISAKSEVYGINFTWEVTVGEPASGIKVIPETLTIIRGETKKLDYKPIPEGTSAGTITWETSDSSIATVDSEGNVTGVGNGTVNITARGSVGAFGSASVTVVTPISSLNLSSPSANLNIGDTVSLELNISPSDASDAPLKWSTGNPYVATVNQHGVVKAVGAGSTLIYVASATLYDSCIVVVNGEDKIVAKTDLISYVGKIGSSFNDISNIEWAQNAIINLVNDGIMLPDSETSFGAMRDITRGEFVDVIIKGLGLTNKRVRSTGKETVKEFSDVPESHVYYKTIKKAYELGIINGVGNDLFAPEATITRQDMAVVIYNALKVASIEINDGKTEFSDDNIIADYAKQSVSSLATNKILLGDGTAFLPLKNTTRAEAAVIVDRIRALK